MLQDTVHDVLRWSNDNRFKLNSRKCKELIKDFQRENNFDTVSLEANGNAFEIVKSAKILGVTVRNDLKWMDHVDDITKKESRRIYLLKQLKCTGMDLKSLILFIVRVHVPFWNMRVRPSILISQPICPIK